MAEYCGSEADRAAILALYDLDAAGLEALDDITGFASVLCRTPIALVSLVEERRQRFLSRIGLDSSETSREFSFCAHAMLGNGLFVIPDATADDRFAGNPLVTGPPQIRFYAGAPLRNGEGVPLGALCVIDSAPRNGLSALETEGLRVLSKQVLMHLEGRRRDGEARLREQRSARALRESEERFRTLADTMPQMVWSTLPNGLDDYHNARWYEFTGMAEGTADGEAWVAMVHPEDREGAVARWRHSLETGEPYEIEYRLRHRSGEYRWGLGRALPVRDGAGGIVRWIGTCTDIHEQKLNSEEREMIAHELSHRIKNIFSVITGLIGLSARERPEIADAASALRERILALGRAHDCVRAHRAQSIAPEPGWNSLHGVLGEIFAPYGAARVAIGGEDVEIDDRSATPLALLFHELATNSAKYGALSVPEGKVLLDIALRGDACRLHWTEAGGPSVEPPAQVGFGTRLMEMTAERQLGGTILRDWKPEGLTVSLAIPVQSMSRSAEKA